jgi:hypothetical protein
VCPRSVNNRVSVPPISPAPMIPISIASSRSPRQILS